MLDLSSVTFNLYAVWLTMLQCHVHPNLFLQVKLLWKFSKYLNWPKFKKVFCSHNFSLHECYDFFTASICGSLLLKSEINPATSGFPTMRIVNGDDTKTVIGVAFREVADKRYPKMQVNYIYFWSCNYWKLPYRHSHFSQETATTLSVTNWPEK